LYKRKIFFKFVEVFLDIYYLQELKAKILQYIILPMFAYTFEDGRVDEVSVLYLHYTVQGKLWQMATSIAFGKKNF